MNQLKMSIRQLKSNLENVKVQNVLQKEQFEIEDLKNALNILSQNIDVLNDGLQEVYKSKINDLVGYSHETLFGSYSHKFINVANFLISSINDDVLNMPNNVKNNKISEEEFLKRYNELIESLNFEGKESNLILEESGKSFSIYKTEEKNLLLYIASSDKPIFLHVERLLEIAYSKKAQAYPFYEILISSMIMDNSIFKHIRNIYLMENSHHELLDEIQSKQSSNEVELLLLNKKLVEIEKSHKELSIAKEELLQIKHESEIASKKFEDAKDAAVKYAQLNASVSYWDIKQEKHNKKFYSFGGFSILLILALFFALFDALEYHKIQIVENKKNDLNGTIVKEIEVNSSALQEKVIVFDYSKIAWYILMIFASSSAFWIIRIMVKIALSNLHLSEDARERVVMIETYLSFVKEGQIEENDKNLILSSLFRPSNIGIIKDESSVTVADMITAFKK